MKLTSAGRTHVGMKRAHNEDSLRIFREENLFVVADGMGGHASGEVASQMAVEAVAEFFRCTAEDDEITWPYKMDKGRKYEENRVVTSVKLSNRRISESASRDGKLKGMGTTIVVAFFINDTVYIAHVGDSRAYRLRDRTLTLLTEDHSLLNDYIKMRQLTPEEIQSFPHKNVIVRALGMKDTVQVDIQTEAPQDGDIYLLCTDGLSGMITDEGLEAIMTEDGDDLDHKCQRLIDVANANGGTDNVTVIVVRYEKD